MTLSSSIELRDEDKLEVLRRLDQHRQWQSLDEKRYCIVCGNILTGREIQIAGNAPETDVLRAVCPTPDCRSIPMDWVRPSDELLASQAVASGNIGAQARMPDQAA